MRAFPIPVPLLMLPLLVPTLARITAADDPQPFPEMAPTIGAILADKYYDRSRFHPRLMVERALRALETVEVSIDTRWQGNAIDLVVKDTHTAVPASEPKDIESAMTLIEEVRRAVDAAGFPKDRARDLDYALVNGALSSLDPHTILIPPEPAKAFNDDISGEFFGIGAWLTQDDGTIAIERVMAGFPAERSGVEDGDRIIAIDGERTAGLALDQAVKRIKGPRGTNVTLTVERGTARRTLDLTITRDLVQIITMRTFRRDGIGYVCMNEFNANTARDLTAAIDELLRDGTVKALVLDLRFNGGGLLDQAKLVCDQFLARGQEIVRTVTIDGRPTVTRSSGRAPYLHLPLAILTSSGSASAAEIFAGAMQRNDRAMVLGNTSFGKGSVQTVMPMRDRSKLKLTIQEYQLPGGVSIQDVGVTPDVALVRHSLKADGALDRLQPYTRDREADEEFALANRAAYRHQSTYSLGYVAPFRTKDEIKRSNISARDFTPDTEATLAMDLLATVAAAADFQAAAQQAGQAGRMRQFLLDRIKKPLEERSEQESQRLAKALEQHQPPVTWGTPGEAPAEGNLTLGYGGPKELATSPVQQPVTSDLPFSVTNNGKAATGRLSATVVADRFSPLWQHEILFGTAAPGQTISGSLRFIVPPRLFAGEERFTVELHRDDDPKVLASLPVSLQIQALPRPHFSLSWRVDGDGITTRTPGQISLVIRNDGEGAASQPVVRVFKSDNAWVQLGETRFTLKGEDGSKQADLAPGATWTIAVPLVIAETLRGQAFTGDTVTLQLSCQETFPDESKLDGGYRSMFSTHLNVPVGQRMTNPRTVIAPKIALVGQPQRPSPDRATFTIAVEDDNPAFLTVFVNEDKTDLRTIGDSRTFPIEVPLKPGANNIRVIVTDRDEVNQVLPIRLWGDGKVATDKIPASAATAPTNDVP